MLYPPKEDNQDTSLKLIPLSPDERSTLVKAPTPIMEDDKNELALVFIRALQGNSLARDRVYSVYLKHQQELVAKLLFMMTGRHISPEIRGTLALKDREEPYKISVGPNIIRIYFDNYIPPCHAGKGEVLQISMQEIDNISGTHPLVSGYISLHNRKPATFSLSGVHKTKIRATTDLDLTFASDKWALVKLIVNFRDKSWTEYSAFVNLVHTKTQEIESAARLAVKEEILEPAQSDYYRIVVDQEGSDYGPLTKIQLQSKVAADALV